VGSESSLLPVCFFASLPFMLSYFFFFSFSVFCVISPSTNDIYRLLVVSLDLCCIYPQIFLVPKFNALPTWHLFKFIIAPRFQPLSWLLHLRYEQAVEFFICFLFILNQGPIFNKSKRLHLISTCILLSVKISLIDYFCASCRGKNLNKTIFFCLFVSPFPSLIGK